MITIIVVLVIIIVIIVNPKKILEKSRDSTRLADITSLESAINLYLADNRDFKVLTDGQVYDSTTLSRKIDGTGWIPLNFTNITSGTPLSILPIDPINDKVQGFYYRFGVNPLAKTYELDCAFESADNIAKQSSDGGNNNSRYEAGTDLTILP
jgi:hypothetical protein